MSNGPYRMTPPEAVTATLSHAVCQQFVNGATIADLSAHHGLHKSMAERIIRVNMQALCTAIADLGAKAQMFDDLTARVRAVAAEQPADLTDSPASGDTDRQ